MIANAIKVILPSFCAFILRVMDKKKVFSFVALVVIVILWGVVPVIGKYLLDNDFYSPALLIAARGLIATLTMAVVVLVTRGYRSINKSYLICIPAGLILASAYIFQFIGLDTTTTSKNVFLESFSVVATPITLLVLIREKPRINSLIAALLCLVGAFILCGDGWDFSEMFKAPTIGDIFSAIGGALFGVNIGFTQVFAKDKNPFVYVSFQLAILTIFSFAYSFIFERPLLFSWETGNIFILLFLSIFCTALCWVVRAIAVKDINAITIVVMNPMSAVIATIIALSIGQEKFAYNLLVGGIIIVAAIIISSIPKRESEGDVHRKTPQQER